ncbi:ABC transporter permease [Microbacterium sp. DT81.1]|uniref:ABC transporter permease n=1 Tax=Microbacterium sp. DT81.1 TaxID=3393413 RepID=UPI003CF4C743
MSAFLHGTWTIAALEVRQRVRSLAWYVLLGIFAVLLIIVTMLASAAFLTSPERFRGTYSVVVYFVLLLAVLVTPALSGNAINGDRDAATLAPVQVTLVTTWQIILGKFLAAWITGLAFVAVAVPFLAFTAIAGGVPPGVLAVSIVVLLVEIAVVAAVGVGLSGILNRALFSVVATYLVVAALTVGTLIAFGLGGTSVKSEAVQQYRDYVYDANGMVSDPPVCGEWQTSEYEVPRLDYVWWTLTPNPFVILADATPIAFDVRGYPVDLFGQISTSVRQVQLPPDLEQRFDGCRQGAFNEDFDTAEQIHAKTTPSWFVGLALQVVLAAAALVWAWARTRTPAGRLPKGTRIA